jgi:hypothetical protein
LTPWKFKPNMSKGSDDKAPLFLSPRLVGTSRGDLFRSSSSFAGVTDLDSLGLYRRKLSTDDLSVSTVETSNAHEVARSKINAFAERCAFHKSNEGRNKPSCRHCRKAQITDWNVVGSVCSIVRDQSIRVHGSIFRAIVVMSLNASVHPLNRMV